MRQAATDQKETTMNIIVTIPPTFYDDHTGRDLPAGEVIKRTKRSIEVKLDAAAFVDLLDDARHYASFEGPDFRDNRSVCMAARALIPHLEVEEQAARLSLEAAAPAPVAAEPAKARPARMKVTRANGTERVTTWRTLDAARSFALHALEAGDYTYAAIEVDGEWVEVVANETA